MEGSRRVSVDVQGQERMDIPGQEERICPSSLLFSSCMNWMIVAHTVRVSFFIIF
jgi:hypothetical protein